MTEVVDAIMLNYSDDHEDQQGEKKIFRLRHPQMRLCPLPSRYHLRNFRTNDAEDRSGRSHREDPRREIGGDDVSS